MSTATLKIIAAAIAVVAIAALALQNQSKEKLRAENQQLRAQADLLSALQAENERLSNEVARAAASQLSPEQMRELIKLRGEVGVLRNQNSRLQKQAAEAADLREQMRQLRAQPPAQAQPAPAPAPAAPSAEENARNACINNLRLINAAKQQWALEKGKGPNDIPTDADLQPYLGRGPNGALPVCPLDPSQTYDTSYTTRAVGAKPTCNIAPASHVLP